MDRHDYVCTVWMEYCTAVHGVLWGFEERDRCVEWMELFLCRRMHYEVVNNDSDVDVWLHGCSDRFSVS